MKATFLVLGALLAASAAHADDAKVTYNCVNDNHDQMVLSNRIQGFDFVMDETTCAVTYDHRDWRTGDHVYRARYNFRKNCSRIVGGTFQGISIADNVRLEYAGGYPDHTSIYVTYLDHGEKVTDEFQCEKN